MALPPLVSPIQRRVVCCWLLRPTHNRQLGWALVIISSAAGKGRILLQKFAITTNLHYDLLRQVRQNFAIAKFCSNSQ
jgi:hypothetical protein